MAGSRGVGVPAWARQWTGPPRRPATLLDLVAPPGAAVGVALHSAAYLGRRVGLSARASHGLASAVRPCRGLCRLA